MRVYRFYVVASAGTASGMVAVPKSTFQEFFNNIDTLPKLNEGPQSAWKQTRRSWLPRNEKTGQMAGVKYGLVAEELRLTLQLAHQQPLNENVNMLHFRPIVAVAHHHLLRYLTRLLDGEYQLLDLQAPNDMAAMRQARAVIVDGSRTFDKTLLDALPNLQLIAGFNAGYDGIDIAWAHAHGLRVTHAVGANEEDVADFAIGQILNIRRRIIVGDQLVRNGEWKMGHRPLTHSVAGLRLGIVGLGQIGQALARRADVMRMVVSWWGPHDKPGVPWPKIGCLLQLAYVSDVLAVTASANGDNSGLISAEVLAALGSTGILINVARGSLVDEDALICALRRGALSAAALDVFREEPTSSHRWHGVPNIILSPHLAGATEEALRRMAELVHLNLNAFFSGKPLPTPVAEAA